MLIDTICVKSTNGLVRACVRSCAAHLLCEEQHSIKNTSGRAESPGQPDIL